jgi:hypothetical protein
MMTYFIVFLFPGFYHLVYCRLVYTLLPCELNHVSLFIVVFLQRIKKRQSKQSDSWHNYDKKRFLLAAFLYFPAQCNRMDGKKV